jgi:hypothetical protein
MVLLGDKGLLKAGIISSKLIEYLLVIVISIQGLAQ